MIINKKLEQTGTQKDLKKSKQSFIQISEQIGIKNFSIFTIKSITRLLSTTVSTFCVINIHEHNKKYNTSLMVTFFVLTIILLVSAVVNLLLTSPFIFLINFVIEIIVFILCIFSLQSFRVIRRD